MSIVVDPYTAVDGADILAAEINARLSTLYALVNGNLDNANVKTGAAIDPAKLDLTKEILDLRAATNRCLSAGTTGDTVPRVSLTADGKVYFGPGGGTAIDTILKRDAAGYLRVRDATDAADAGLRTGTLGLNSTLISDFLAQGVTPGGRLTLTSGTPVTTADVTAATNVYYAIHNHNLLPSYSATEGAVVLRKFTEITISLAGLAANTNYDVYAKYSGGAWAGSTVAWAGDTTRGATTPSRLAGSSLYASSADTEATYLGTIRTTGTIGQCEDSRAKRYVWNNYNRVQKQLLCRESTATWTYTTATFREANAGTTEGSSRVGMVRGFDFDAVPVSLYAIVQNSSATIAAQVAIGLDSSTTPETTVNYGNPNLPVAGGRNLLVTHYNSFPGVGYRTLRWLEYSAASGTCTWTSGGLSGISGTCLQ